jgi:hypothetical protein
VDFLREPGRAPRYAGAVQPLASTPTNSPLAALDQSAIGRAALARHLPENAHVSMLRALSVLAFELTRRCTQEPALSEVLAILSTALAALDEELARLTDQPLRVDSASLEASLLARDLLSSEAGTAQRVGQAHGLLSGLSTLVAGHPAPAPVGAQHPALTSPEGALDAARAASCALQAGIVRVVEAVGQLHDAAGGLLAAINVEAGHHALPDDVRELTAAFAASDASFHAVRYYAERFGERGVRFSRSDSCWLATLARSSSSEAHKHIRWLGRVLSNRGMPEILLERHLVTLHEALCAAVPEHAAEYTVLSEVARALAEARTSAMPEAAARTLSERFVRDVGRTSGPIDPHEASLLLCSAVADLRNGAPRAVASLASFLGDATRFGTRWAGAVKQLIAETDSAAP